MDDMGTAGWGMDLRGTGLGIDLRGIGLGIDSQGMGLENRLDLGGIDLDSLDSNHLDVRDGNDHLGSNNRFRHLDCDGDVLVCRRKRLRLMADDR